MTALAIDEAVGLGKQKSRAVTTALDTDIATGSGRYAPAPTSALTKALETDVAAGRTLTNCRGENPISGESQTVLGSDHNAREELQAPWFSRTKLEVATAVGLGLVDNRSVTLALLVETAAAEGR
jgi:hypothetical protein